MNIFGRPHYTSDATQFIDSLKASRPELDEQQRQGRALLWEQSVDHAFNAEAEEANVAQKPYVYQAEPSLR